MYVRKIHVRILPPVLRHPCDFILVGAVKLPHRHAHRPAERPALVVQWRTLCTSLWVLLLVSVQALVTQVTAKLGTFTTSVSGYM